MKSVCFLLLAGVTSLTGCVVKPLLQEQIDFEIGDRQIALIVHRAKHDGYRYVVLHDNENTASRAARSTLRRHGGVLLEVVHDGDRNVSFEHEGKRYRFDPNRIFTPQGTESTLADLSMEPPPPAVRDRVAALGEAVVALLTSDYDGLIVAVHNNTDQEYAASSYLPEADLADEADRVHLEPGEDPDDFFFTTSQTLFEQARSAGFNAVLQHQRAPTDDGSLSVLAARKGIPYVNAEAQHGHLRKQKRMLEFLTAIEVEPATAGY